MTNHVLNLEEPMRDYQFDEQMILNLNETEMSARRDCYGSRKKKGVVSSKLRFHVRGADFDSNISCVSFECIGAAANVVCPLWIFKDRRLQYRVVRNFDRTGYMESAVHLLLDDSLVGTRLNNLELTCDYSRCELRCLLIALWSKSLEPVSFKDQLTITST